MVASDGEQFSISSGVVIRDYLLEDECAVIWFSILQCKFHFKVGGMFFKCVI